MEAWKKHMKYARIIQHKCSFLNLVIVRIR